MAGEKPSARVEMGRVSYLLRNCAEEIDAFARGVERLQVRVEDLETLLIRIRENSYFMLTPDVQEDMQKLLPKKEKVDG